MLSFLTATVITAGLALAGPVASATVDVPVPPIADLDMLPEAGAWPCTLTVEVDSLGAVGAVAIDRDCPSGLRDAAGALGKAHRFLSAAAPHTDELTVVFRMLANDAAEPKAETARGRLVYVLRPLEVTAPPVAATRVGKNGKPAPEWEIVVPKTKLPGAAAAAGVTAGTCVVRLDVAPDGSVTRARASRCVDTLAGPAVAAGRKVKFKLAEGAKPPEALDLVVRFEASP